MNSFLQPNTACMSGNKIIKSCTITNTGGEYHIKPLGIEMVNTPHTQFPSSIPVTPGNTPDSGYALTRTVSCLSIDATNYRLSPPVPRTPFVSLGDSADLENPDDMRCLENAGDIFEDIDMGDTLAGLTMVKLTRE